MQHLMPQIVFYRELISYKLLRVKAGETRAQYKPSPSKKSPVLLLQNFGYKSGFKPFSVYIYMRSEACNPYI